MPRWQPARIKPKYRPVRPRKPLGRRQRAARANREKRNPRPARKRTSNGWPSHCSARRATNTPMPSIGTCRIQPLKVSKICGRYSGLCPRPCRSHCKLARADGVDATNFGGNRRYRIASTCAWLQPYLEKVDTARCDRDVVCCACPVVVGPGDADAEARITLFLREERSRVRDRMHAAME